MAHVLVPLDGSSLAECVLPFAEGTAAATGARLTLLRVVDTPTPGGEPVDAFDWEMRWSEARAYLNRIAAEMAGRGTVADVELAKGRPADQVLAWAREHAVDLVLLSTHGEGGVTGWNLSSTAEKILRRSPTSVLIVPAHAERTTAPEAARLRRLLVPLDLSPRAECVLPLVVSLARHEDAEIVLVHVVPEPEMPRHAPPSREDRDLAARVVARNEEEARRYLEDLHRRLSSLHERVRTRLEVASRCCRRLRRIAEEEDADLVVVCAHGQSAEPAATQGQVPGRLARELTRPVLIVQDMASGRAALPTAAAVEESPGH